jgi:hypothetical protein
MVESVSISTEMGRFLANEGGFEAEEIVMDTIPGL